MKNSKISTKYFQLINSAPKINKTRNKIIESHFPEILLNPLIEKEDINVKIKKIINKELSHPCVFLASSLGFTKSNWSKTIEKILIELGISKLKNLSYKNMLKFEKLKHLIFRFLERKKEGLID